MDDYGKYGVKKPVHLHCSLMIPYHLSVMANFIGRPVLQERRSLTARFESKCTAPVE